MTVSDSQETEIRILFSTITVFTEDKKLNYFKTYLSEFMQNSKNNILKDILNNTICVKLQSLLLQDRKNESLYTTRKKKDSLLTHCVLLQQSNRTRERASSSSMSKRRRCPGFSLTFLYIKNNEHIYTGGPPH